MRAWILRGLLALFLIAILGMRVNSLQADNTITPGFNVRLATEALLRRHDATLLPRLKRSNGRWRQVIRFEVKGCAHPIIIYPFDITTDGRSKVESGGFVGRATRIAYMGRTWDTQEPIYLFLSWLEQRVRFALGDHSFLPTRTALIIAAMPDCQPHLDLDWSPVWQPNAI